MMDTLPAPPEVDVRDEELGRLVETMAFVSGKKVVMLGSESRPQVAQELGELLVCTVSCLDSDRSDKFNNFGPAVKKANVVLLLNNSASNKILCGGKEVMVGGSEHFVVIPSRYSVKQVVYQLSEYVAKVANRETVAA